MSKVVLLAINAKYVHSSLSVWVIAEGVSLYSRFPHDVNIVEATINQSCADIVSLVAPHKPDVIGISSYIWNAGMLSGLCTLLRERLPGVLIVLGGPEASNNIDYWLNNGADYVLQGEGEYTFPQFLDSLEKPGQGDGSRQGDGSSVLPEAKINQLSNNKTEEPSPCLEPSPCHVNPYTDAYFKSLNGRLSYIEASRGCPFECSFCLSAGSSVRFFPLDEIKMQILKLSKSDTKTIKFVDRTINCNPERAFKIIEYIIGLDTLCKFHFEAAADLFDDPTLSLLKTAPPGLIQLEIGLQSLHEPTVKAVARKTDTEKAMRNIHELVKMQNIHIHIDLIAGLPYETLMDFQNSFNRAYLLNTHTLQLGFLKLLYGSELRNNAAALGIEYSSAPPYEIIQSKWLSIEDIITLKHVENALQNTRNKNRFLSVIHYVLTLMGQTPFSLMHSIGSNVPNHGTQLENYIIQLFNFFLKLPGVDESDLKDCFIYDWLSMVKGKNTPAFLKNDCEHRNYAAKSAEKTLGRKIRREEYAVLNSGSCIFVDSNSRSPVTGLYEVFIIK
ncbi:MAG: B12-binding domain-containing radical SAM protein [Oscillospiraceae bacterium]|nr:B12-binding domain-containing radical SAM protein [Oscillospiraceae bacterium]